MELNKEEIQVVVGAMVELFDEYADTETWSKAASIMAPYVDMLNSMEVEASQDTALTLFKKLLVAMNDA